MVAGPQCFINVVKCFCATWRSQTFYLELMVKHRKEFRLNGFAVLGTYLTPLTHDVLETRVLGETRGRGVSQGYDQGTLELGGRLEGQSWRRFS